MTPIRVLIVDDSVVIRRLLSDVLSSDPAIEVVGTASNGRIGLDRIRQLSPDLVTLDIEMPELDGLATLVELRREFPRLPVIMFSTLTERGASATIEALASGANDYVTKPANVGSTQAAIAKVRDDLIPKVKALTGRSPSAPPAPRRAAATADGRAVSTPDRRRSRERVSVIGIGTSTGGPNALERVLPLLPHDLGVPIAIVQHMPPMFTRLLAERLDTKCALHVVEATDGQTVQPGTVYLAPGGLHLEIVRGPGALSVTRLTEDPPENFCRPAVDVLFRSLVGSYGAGTLGLVMTGMGHDGLAGAREIVDHGGQMLVQDEATSVVWGMPGFVARDGIADEVLPLDSIAPALERRVRAGQRLGTPVGTAVGS